MYEPLFDVEIPDRHVTKIVSPAWRGAASDSRKVVIITEIFEQPGGPDHRLAERNTLAILERLLRSGKAGLLAVADHDQEFHFNPYRSEELQREAAKARADFRAGRILVSDLAGKALISPTVPVVGVADHHHPAAQRARRQRVDGLRRLALESVEVPAPVTHTLLRALQNAGWSEHLTAVEQPAAWPDLYVLLDGLMLPALRPLVRHGMRQLGLDEPPAGSALPVAVAFLASAVDEVLHALPPLAVRQLATGLLTHLGEPLLRDVLDQASIPLLRRLRKGFGELKSRCYPPWMRQAEALFGPRRRIEDLLDLARQVGIDLADYPSLRQHWEARRLAPRHPVWRLESQRSWLAWAVGEALLGNPSSGELRGLLEKALREEKSSILDSTRPLFECAHREQAGLYEAIALDLEENDPLKPHLLRKLLDLASLLGLDDRNYRAYRRHVGSTGRSVDASVYLAELTGLEEEMVTRCAAVRPEARELYDDGRRLDVLEDLVREQLSLERAERVLADPPSALELVETLAARGIGTSSRDRREARLLDELCVPPALDFYRHCESMAPVIGHKLFEQMNARRAQGAVLLCGGFYADKVAGVLSEGALCSIVMPHFVGEERHDRSSTHPKEMRDATQSIWPRARLHVYGGGLPQKIDRARGITTDQDAPLDPFARNADAKRWTQLHWWRTRFEDALQRLHGEVLHECRVCKRRAPLEESPVISLGGHAPDLVLRCPECDRAEGRFVCGRCAGREPVPLLPGHAAAEAEGPVRRAEVLVCNVHGVPLGDPKRSRRVLAGGMPGHVTS